ncbi:Uncharacterized protein OBRU01_15358 [Operophtera brumata]|uniref:Cytochrome P450 n=1 Tax=Operophtera brumata TaxID=104452 RepID=A0A0L7L583_OPEBR|nr:Uncharacterized protein OBRU01_15358 [Operophtera brumata]
MIVWLLLLLTVAWTVVYRYRRRNMYRLAASMPALKEELPVIGVAHYLTGNTEDIMRSLQKFSYEAMENDGSVIGWLCHILYFVPIWRRRRKILVPAFSPKVVENFIDVFTEQKTAMGVKINSQGNPDSVFLKSINRILNLVCKRIFHLWLQPEWLFKLFPQSREHDYCMKQMHDFTDDVNLGAYKRKTFLDLLISLSGGEKGYNNEKLREEVLGLTVAGTDTSAVAVGCTLKLLGKYPEIQEKFLSTASGRTMPAGSGIAVSIWGLHRDPKYWGPDAEHIDPDRFLPERFNVPPCSYMPFSSGPRNCLGYQYALISIKTALSAVLRRFKVVGEREEGPIPKIRVKLGIMMKAVDEYELALERRALHKDN